MFPSLSVFALNICIYSPGPLPLRSILDNNLPLFFIYEINCIYVKEEDPAHVFELSIHFLIK